MPDTFSLTTGVSLGLLAGIVSGVYYFVVSSYPRPRSERDTGRCLKSAREDIICRRCGGDLRGGPVPCICYTPKSVNLDSGALFRRQAQRAFCAMPWSISTDKLEQIEEECDNNNDAPGPSDATQAELKKIREFLETISAKLAGGPLEGTKVAPLYNHPAYLPPKRNVPGPNPSSVGASGAHVQLKRLVARVVEEASGMPSLTRYPAEPHTPSLESSTYEDLLATAILNKVIERYQNENGSGGRSSGIHSASASPTPSERSSPRSLNSRHNRDITPPMHEEDDVSDWEEGTDEAVELPRRVPFPEFGRDIVHDIDNEEREFDEVSSSDLQAVDGSWEENWLFQKKKIKTQSVPVPMLVPNSNTEYRALIGDRDADDTTDLSDNASDSEEQIADYKSDMKRVIDSKHVIGGQPKAYESDFEPDSLTSIDAGDEFDQLVDKIEDDRTVNAFIDEINDNKLNIVETINHNASDQVDGGKLVLSIDSGPLSKAEFAMKEEIHRSLFNGNADGLTDSFHAKTNGVLHNSVSDLLHGEDSFISNKESMSTHSRHEREGEYEETVARPVQRHADSLRRKHFEDGPEFRTQFTDQNHELIPGSIAYRERKKWLNYVDMPNNPYSPEAIQKRLSTKNSATLFDMFTKKESEDGIEISDHDERQIIEEPKKNINRNKLTLAHSNDSINNIDRSTKSASPRVLKDIVAEDIPQYRRFGRDYYVREAKSSSGGRKKTSMSETSSVSSMNKSASLDNFDTEFMSPVSASSSLSDLEASALHQNIVRAVLSPRNASPNFAINPIFENPDRQNNNADENHAIADRVGLNANVRERRTVCNGGDGFVENEDIVRLKIPKIPEMTEDLFETYTNVRRSNTLRNENLYVLAKRRPPVNFRFGGSLRLSKSFRTDIW